MRKIFLTALLVLCFSTVAWAQQVPNYLFVEAVDSKGAPVKDATVQTGGVSWENNRAKEVWGEGAPTGETGKTRIEIFRGYSGANGKKFRVLKSGYYPYYDLGTSASGYNTFAKIELLKIPVTDEERRLVSDEQTKREFMLAVKNGEVEAVRRFIKSGVSPNLNTDDLRGIAGPKNVPAIIFAAAAGDNEMLKLFLKSKVNIRKKDEPVRSILTYYLFADRFSMTGYLTPQQIVALNAEYEAGVKMLVAAGAEFQRFPGGYRNATALMLAAQRNNLNLVKFFLDKGVSVNARNDDGETVLFYAPDAMFDFLLAAGADPNLIANADKPNCRSVLMQAVWTGSLRVINSLIAYKADVNFTCPNGNNALKTAQERKNYGYLNDTDTIIKILKLAGAK
jgi:ankyrin repeat protein